MQLYNAYKRGFLYYDGGITDQPDWYVKAMRVIDSVMNEREAQNYEQLKRSKGLD